MRVGMLQQNYVVGDIKGNTRKIIDGYKEAVRRGAELVVGSELAIFGYPPKDLLENTELIYRQFHALDEIMSVVHDVGLILGIAELNDSEGKLLFNRVVLISNGAVTEQRSKALLPTYDVFDEARYFAPGTDRASVFQYGGLRIGMLVCEDIWSGTENPFGDRLYAVDPIKEMTEAVPNLLVVVNGSPYYWGKGNARLELVSEIAQKLQCSVVYVNQVGGNDDLVFDGRSFATDKDGRCIASARSFEEDLVVFDTKSESEAAYPFDKDDVGELRRALVLAIRDYFAKTGHKKAILGLSGGIDSAVTAALAVEALGRENVVGIGMPSGFSSEGSLTDAKKLAENLGIAFKIIPISNLYDAFGVTVKDVVGWQEPGVNPNDVTEENVQARLRGSILMAYSNRNGALVLSTGNKSELAVGYCTLYGDMAGGFAAISDVPKMLVYELAKNINREREVIPQASITKAPSAELRLNQKDADSLPPYPILDRILHLYVEEQRGFEEMVAGGLDPDTVRWVIRKVSGNEYKRRQAAPGPKVTNLAFGSGRRYPIASRVEI